MSSASQSSWVCFQPDEEVPDGSSQQVFGSMNDQPLCSLYSPAGAEGFRGPCDPLPTTCSRNSSWCNGGSNPDSDAVEELMALQFTKASELSTFTVLRATSWGPMEGPTHRVLLVSSQVIHRHVLEEKVSVF